MKTVLVTGGSGFIGSNFLNRFVRHYPDWTFINVDKLTYAADPANTAHLLNEPNYVFEQADICDETAVKKIFGKYQPHWVIHFAAETHVDRSISGPEEFLKTNVLGTFTMLEACRTKWPSFEDHLFLHISTDEVYGSLENAVFADESAPYNPSSPYSASKAASDHLARSYHRTYRLPIVITTSSNNYGPNQFPEKLIPLIILKALKDEPLPVYGNGENVRDWLHVEDNCEAIWQVANKGIVGQTYNIGAGNLRTNIEVVYAICDAVADQTDTDNEEKRELACFVSDRPGHDLRYAVSTKKIEKELGWQPKKGFDTGLRETVQLYLNDFQRREQTGGKRESGA